MATSSLKCSFVFVLCCLLSNFALWIFLPPYSLNPSEILRMLNKTTTHSRLTEVAERSPLQVDNLQLHIQSAVVNEKKSTAHVINVIITAWIGSNVSSFLCCFTTTAGQRVAVSATLLHTFARGELMASQFSCEVFRNISLLSTLTFSSSSCSQNTHRRLDIVYPEQAADKMAVCLKCVYGHPDIRKMVEWLELQKLQGVSKVLAFHFKLHARVKRVLQFYQEQGYLELLPFVIAGTVARKGKSKRGFQYQDRVDEWQFRSDEQITVFECQERLSGYSYVGIYDMDEVIVPERFNTNNTNLLVKFLKYLDFEYPSAGAYVFRVENFVSDWGKSNNESRVSLMQYVLRSKPMGDYKIVHKPERLAWAKTHSVKLREQHTGVLVSRSIGTIHHYRSCRPNWKQGICFSLTRFQDRQLLRWEKQLLNKIHNLPLHVKYLLSNKSDVKKINGLKTMLRCVCQTSSTSMNTPLCDVRGESSRFTSRGATPCSPVSFTPQRQFREMDIVIVCDREPPHFSFILDPRHFATSWISVTSQNPWISALSQHPGLVPISHKLG